MAAPFACCIPIPSRYPGFCGSLDPHSRPFQSSSEFPPSTWHCWDADASAALGMSPQGFRVGPNPKLMEEHLPPELLLPGSAPVPGVTLGFGAAILTSQLHHAHGHAQELPPLHGWESSRKQRSLLPELRDPAGTAPASSVLQSSELMQLGWSSSL